MTRRPGRIQIHSDCIQLIHVALKILPTYIEIMELCATITWVSSGYERGKRNGEQRLQSKPNSSS